MFVIKICICCDFCNKSAVMLNFFTKFVLWIWEQRHTYWRMWGSYQMQDIASLNHLFRKASPNTTHLGPYSVSCASRAVKDWRLLKGIICTQIEIQWILSEIHRTLLEVGILPNISTTEKHLMPRYLSIIWETKISHLIKIWCPATWASWDGKSIWDKDFPPHQHSSTIPARLKDHSKIWFVFQAFKHIYRYDSQQDDRNY